MAGGLRNKHQNEWKGDRMSTSKLLLVVALICAPAFCADTSRGRDRLVREVRHELVMLPYYGVFDNLAYRVDGTTVILLGQVTRPTLKSDAANTVQRIEGVDKVDNQIQVLPLSSVDDHSRLAVYRAIYGHPGLDRYALQAIPPIH